MIGCMVFRFINEIAPSYFSGPVRSGISIDSCYSVLRYMYVVLNAPTNERDDNSVASFDNMYGTVLYSRFT